MNQDFPRPALAASHTVLADDVMEIRLRPAVLDWLRELAVANGISVEPYAAFLLQSFCEERMEGRPNLDLSGFEVIASVSKTALRLPATHCLAVPAGDWIRIVEAVLLLTGGGQMSSSNREIFVETVLDRLATELGGVR
ncbi:hypothetical protein SAMN05216345_111145 [Cupriavidus sp. YR651]|uniref:hypothetical protein n=1 Tax=Cupriavidus sp. YR651 TaxID=1855315 RepID=UPI0008874C93|nr:hypothetical protein [Cupriavidus sp. YR651]SDD58466.1 hypothetical protein SAMN05216345_111145 [Cupriavidus sp. YR651]